jgi:hypothetical protein
MTDLSAIQGPREIYDSREQLEKDVKESALRSGFAAVVLKSDKHYVTLGCSKHPRNSKGVNFTFGNASASQSSQRLKAVQVGSCAWMLKYNLRKDGLWHLAKKHLEHNHAMPVQGLHQARRLNAEELAKVHNLTKVGLPPRHIRSVLIQENPSTKAVIRDIYNARFLMRKEQMNGEKPITLLLKELQTDEWVFDFAKDGKNQLTHLFFAYKEAVEFTSTCHNVFLMDCTYKTNRFNMPLLNIVGLSPLFTTFNVAFCFMRGEKEDDYKWALERLKKIVSNSYVKAIITDRDLALGKTRFLIQ